MKKIISLVLAFSMLMGIAGAQVDSGNAEQETSAMESYSFDSIRELVEWVQSRDPEEYSGEFRDFIEETQENGELLAVMEEEYIRYISVLPSRCEIWYTFSFDKDKYRQVVLRWVGSESAETDKEPIEYFRDKYPKAEFERASARIVTDGEAKDVNGVIEKSVVGENNVEVEIFVFLADGFEISVTAWSPSFEYGIFENISFARIELDGEYVTDVTREKFWLRVWQKTGEDGETITAHISDDGKIFERFDDVQQHSWYGWGVANAIKSGAMTGIGEGKFGPELPVSRAMIVTCLWRLEKHRGYYTYCDVSSPFADVAQDKWYTLPVLWAAGNGIANGTAKDMFFPEGEITRQDMAVMIYRYLTKYRGYTAELTPEQEEQFPKAVFADGERISHYARDAVDWLSRLGILKGKDGNAFDPFGKVTRAEAAVIISRMNLPGHSGPENMP